MNNKTTNIALVIAAFALYKFLPLNYNVAEYNLINFAAIAYFVLLTIIVMQKTLKAIK